MATERLIRVGRVSSIDYENGMIRVTYPDLDDSVTALFPVFSMCDEYKMPGVGQEVVVLHLSSGTTGGVVLGRYWNTGNNPSVSGEGVFRKELGEAFDEAYIQYSSSTVTVQSTNGSMLLLAPSGTLTLTDSGGSITVTELLNRLTSIESRLTSIESRLSSVEAAI